MLDNRHHQLAINQAANLILKQKVESLQVIPVVALKLLRLTNDDDTKVAELSKLIETEPTLAAKILRNVNSAAFALTHKITSINRAVNILGFSAVRQLTLNQLIYNKIIKHKAKQEFDQLFFWQHCLFVASLSRSIAIALNHKDPDTIYSAGLMHDIGKIVLETHGKISYSNFITACKNDEQTIIKGEHDFFGLNHAEMGFVFCQQWEIPEKISAIVYCHHDMPDDKSRFAIYKSDIAIISFANYIAWLQGIGSVSSNNLPELHPEVSKYLDAEKLDFERLLNQVDQEMQNTRIFYGTKFPSLNKLRAALVETTLLINHQNKLIHSTHYSGKLFNSSLIVPHQSLDAEEIIPWTLEAIHSDFQFERIIMLTINPKQRSLFAAYSCPKTLNDHTLSCFNIDIDLLPRFILTGLRERKSMIVNYEKQTNSAILEVLDTKEFIVIPVLSNNRLTGIIYADNYITKTPIESVFIEQLEPIIRELGVALANSKRFELEKKRAELDPLTGLFNKRMMIKYLNSIFNSKENSLTQLLVGFIDIDFFKKFNDNCGHQAGDDVLKVVAQILRTLTRPSDFIGRYGGEEFVFVLQGTDKQGAFCYAERIREEIQRKGQILSQRFQGHVLTVSIGICEYNSEYTRYDLMLDAADKAMYAAKHKGRNCVVLV